jgi:hypothetical protein
MARIAIIVTEKVERDDGTIHWLKKGTLVEVCVDDKEQEYVQCVAPVYGVDIAQFQKRKHHQYINQEDFIEIDPEQLAALRECLLLHPELACT